MKKIMMVVCLCTLALSAFAADEAKPVITLTGYKNQVVSVAFTKDSKKVITAGGDMFIKIRDIKTGRPELVMAHGAVVQKMAYSPDGRYIASSGKNPDIKLWNVKDGALLQVAPIVPGSVSCLVFSPDSDFIAAGCFSNGKGWINIWQTSDLKKPLELDTAGNWSKAMAFSADGNLFLSAGGNTISIWDVEYGDIISAVSGNGGVKFTNKRDFDFGCVVFDADFSPDSKYFSACGADGTGITWRIEDRLIAWKQPAHNGIALCLAYSKNYMATAGSDAMINFFSVKSGKPVFSIAGCAGRTNDLAFSPDGKLIAAACEDNAVPVWKVQKAGKYQAGAAGVVIYAFGFTGLVGMIAIAAFIFRKKKSVKDWKV